MWNKKNAYIYLFIYFGVGVGILGAFSCPTDALSLSNDTCSTLVSNHSRSSWAFRSAESIIHSSPLNSFPSGIFQGSIFHSIPQIFIFYFFCACLASFLDSQFPEKWKTDRGKNLSEWCSGESLSPRPLIIQSACSSPVSSHEEVKATWCGLLTGQFFG